MDPILFPKTFAFFAEHEPFDEKVADIPHFMSELTELYYLMYIGIGVLAKQFERGELVLVQEQDIDKFYTFFAN